MKKIGFKLLDDNEINRFVEKKHRRLNKTVDFEIDNTVYSTELYSYEVEIKTRYNLDELQCLMGFFEDIMGVIVGFFIDEGEQEVDATVKFYKNTIEKVGYLSNYGNLKIIDLKDNGDIIVKKNLYNSCFRYPMKLKYKVINRAIIDFLRDDNIVNSFNKLFSERRKVYFSNHNHYFDYTSNRNSNYDYFYLTKEAYMDKVDEFERLFDSANLVYDDRDAKTILSEEITLESHEDMRKRKNNLNTKT